MFILTLYTCRCCAIRPPDRRLWRSHIVLLVLVLLVLAGSFDGVDWLLLDDGAIGLRRVADVVAALVHVVRALVPVPVFVHCVEQDEDAERRCCYDADHHSRRAAGLAKDFRRARITLRTDPCGIGWKRDRNQILKKCSNQPFIHCYISD